MNNRFDEMVEEAVGEVELSPERSAPKPNRDSGSQKVVSFGGKADTEVDSAKRKSPKREPKRAGQNDAAATLARGLTRPLVTKTVRFRPQLAEALNRIVLQNKLAGKKPDTIQDVVNEAAQAWVKNHEA
jgi:hypothetical protein